MKKLTLLFLALVVLLPYGLSLSRPPAWRAKVDVRVLDAAGPVEAIVSLQEQADLRPAARLSTQAQKGQFVGLRLQQTAARSQAALLAQLEAYAKAHPGQLQYRSLWLVNAVWLRADAAFIVSLAQRSDVRRIDANSAVKMDLETPEPAQALAPQSPDAVEWNLLKVGADKVWAAGVTGQGVTVGGQDTGYLWNHEALKSQYRGWNGSSANHDYNWHDAIHSPPTASGDSPFPIDPYGHGTHTMGIMVGDDGNTEHIGMAPAARWIGCRNMDAAGNGTPATYIECYQWFLAPTPVGAASPLRYDLAPQVINNSWACLTGEGCITPGVLITAVQNIRAAGIVTVHSAGNSGNACGSIDTPAAIYAESFTVGNTLPNDQIAASSSRGPVTVDGSNRLKPDISAPGTSIYSSYNDGSYRSLTGTSMAAPHVAGLVALLISAKPSLAGDVDQIENLIKQNAATPPSESGCAPYPGPGVPNTSYGWGRIDAARTVGAVLPHALSVAKTSTLPGYVAGELITYTLSVSDSNLLAPTSGLRLTDTLPAHTTFVSASGSYALFGDQVVWTQPTLAAGQVWKVTLVVRADVGYQDGILNQTFLASSADAPKAYGQPLSLFLVRNYLPLLRK